MTLLPPNTEFEKTALKTERLLAELKTNLALMEKSKVCTGGQYRDALEECTSYLVRTNLIYPPTMRHLGLREGMTLAERKDVLKVSGSPLEETEDTRKFQDMLLTAGRKSLAQNWVWRIGQETRYMAQKGWYGFFVTLTVDPQRIANSQQMWMEGRELRKFLRVLGRISCKAFGHPNAIKDGDSLHHWVRHVGVIEHGKSEHHHHMHLLIWLRECPPDWKRDPNKGAPRPEQRTVVDCIPGRALWPHHSQRTATFQYLRHEGDVWTRLGFHLPYNKKRKAILRVTTPEKAGLYIAKYMEKEDKKWLHRIKATRKIGLDLLRTHLRNLHLRPLTALTWRPTTYAMSVSLTTIQSCPAGLLRWHAKRELFFRKLAAKTLDFRNELQKTMNAFGLMLQSVRDGAKPHRMRSEQFYEWVTEHLPVDTEYCEKRLHRALVKMASEFPVDNPPTITHTGMA